MATLDSSLIDEDGNLIMKISSDPNDDLTLATAGTYIDKNIVLNFNVNEDEIIEYVDTQDALKAPLDSPALTGTPTTPTAEDTSNDTTIANTEFVKIAVALAQLPGIETLDDLDNHTIGILQDMFTFTTMDVTFEDGTTGSYKLAVLNKDDIS